MNLLRAKIKSCPRTSLGLLPQREQNLFCLISHGRSGSTLFFDLLSRCPMFSGDYDPALAELLSRPSFAPAVYIDAMRRKLGGELWGFHLKLHGHLSMIYGMSEDSQRRFLVELHNRGFKFVHLERTNVFAVAASIFVAAERALWQTNSNQIPRAKIYICPRRFYRCLVTTRERISLERRLLSHFDYLPLVYEADLLDPTAHQATIDRFADFIGIQSFEPQSSLQRLGSKRFQDSIENWEEIESFLAFTDFRGAVSSLS